MSSPLRDCAALCGAALLSLALAGPARAQLKEPAELLPAGTLACIEVRQPERLAREVAALTRNSVLEDMAAAMAKFRARLGEDRPYLGKDISLFGSFLSPEMIAEAGRLRGAALALTGLGKDGP